MSTTCPRCIGLRTVMAAGSREPRPCPSCDGKGVLSANPLCLDEAELEVLQLRSVKADYERRIRELEAEVAALRGAA